MVLGIADSIVGVAGKVLDKFVADKDLKAKLDFELRKAYSDANLAQIDVNKEQAKHPSLFVAGARPSIMWICAFALGWQFIFAPIISWGLVIWYPVVTLPSLQTAELTSLVMALLGLGGMRSFEKSKGVQRNNMNRR